MKGIKMINQWQQGDVIGIRIDAVPAGAKSIKPIDNKIVVMHGESGHTHVIKSNTASADVLTYQDLYK
jgi:hypothetical protein